VPDATGPEDGVPPQGDRSARPIDLLTRFRGGFPVRELPVPAFLFDAFLKCAHGSTVVPHDSLRNSYCA
jgi:hypothetical protein